jgi:hypothetical protein
VVGFNQVLERSKPQSISRLEKPLIETLPLSSYTLDYRNFEMFLIDSVALHGLVRLDFCFSLREAFGERNKIVYGTRWQDDPRYPSNRSVI